MTNGALYHAALHYSVAGTFNSVDSLTEDFIKDLVESGDVGDFSLVHADIFIKNPHLLEENMKRIFKNDAQGEKHFGN